MPSREQIAALLVALASSALLPAQRGDRAGEVQPPLPEDLVVPPAPVLDPEAALDSIRVADGFRVELVAAEPLINDPIAMTFDARGRIWVVEMRGFMPDVDANGELEPNGRIVVLEDVDHNGVMDQGTVFVDGLVLPRAVGLVEDGVLVIEPPNMWFYRDADGDGVWDGDERERVADGFDAGLANPEHAANSFMHGLDNWIYLANHPARLRRGVDGTWVWSPATSGGQWGLTMDDRGRLYYNTNSDFLRADLYPGHYGIRHPHQGNAVGINHRVIRNQSVWPIRVTPGINRGYQDGMLRDGVLTRTTAVCGPVVYRGHLFPEEFHGNVFICEPAGNLVRRTVLSEETGRITGENPYEQAEFLASTDERFRPVNLYNGPDGALYVVDMYRGILQHRNFVTTFLRTQILERELETPLGLGRIYRVVPARSAREQRVLDPQTPLADLTNPQLVDQLKHPNGWTRDTAQRLLVERRDRSVVPALKRLVRSANDAIPRIHAMWTLEGMEALTRYEVLVAMDDGDPLVRQTGVRLAEGFLKERHDVFLMERLRLAAEAEANDPAVLLQAALSLGELQGDQPTQLLADLALRHADNRLLRSVILSGSYGRETRLLDLLLEIDGSEETEGQITILQELAGYVVSEKDVEELTWLLNAVAAASRHAAAILSGMVQALPNGDARSGYLVLPEAPASLGSLARSDDQPVRDLVARFVEAIAIRDPDKTVAPDDTLNEVQRRRFAAGARQFGIHCAVCHQRSGRGMDGLAPPLRNSEWLLGSTQRPIRIILHGMTGPVDVAGESFDMSMPGHPSLDDEQIASILTYLRRAWDHRADVVEPNLVRMVREATAGREAQWTATELDRLR